MKTSPEIDKIAAAIAAVQAQAPQLIADKVNPFFKSKYADLNSIIECLHPHLVKYKLSVMQGGGDHVDGHCTVTSRIMHESGQWIEDIMYVPMAKKDAQAAGSALTYGRRYLLAAQFNLAAEDDDGAAASKIATNQRRDKAALTPIDDKQIKQATEFFTALSAGEDGIKATCDKFSGGRVNAIDAMMKTEASAMIAALNKKHCADFALVEEA